MLKKVAALAVVAMIAMLAASQPAMAGVGGCSPRPGGAGCRQLPRSWPLGKTPVRVDNLPGVHSYDVIAAIKALAAGKKDSGTLQQPGDTTIQGVGGCIPRPGVGGCLL